MDMGNVAMYERCIEYLIKLFHIHPGKIASGAELVEPDVSLQHVPSCL